MKSPARPLVVGHRGASAARPENTVEAFRHARHLGADWVELDVRRTADGTLVVHHDAVLADGRVIVELVAADLPESVAPFAAALDACTGMGVNVEIKNDRRDPDFDDADEAAVAVADLLVAEADAGRIDLEAILVTSFNPATVGVVHHRRPAIPTGLLAFDVADPEAVVAQAAAGGHVAVNPWDPYVDERLMELAAAAGLAVFPWTVDDPDRMRRLLALGVAGIITNVPDVARAALDAG
jgi:glycerophosphoryl diester phosphodiesterase